LNLQNFGPTKASRPGTLRAFADAIRRYDLVAVQEVQDISGEAPRALLAAIQASEPAFDMLLSDNSCREPEDRIFRERYAFYFRTNVVQPIGAPVLFDDSAADLFNREPFLGKFRAGSFDFVLLTIHTSPDQALDEIASLDHAMRWAAATLDPDVIAVGDYNASCDYASTDELDALAVRAAPYTWIVTDEADTNVSATTACAYDRIVVSASVGVHFTGRWGIEHPTPWFSDHWPVSAEFAGE
jgi:endonuclease/exonuclease/phosphatase family metal-dependent hydrolase